MIKKIELEDGRNITVNTGLGWMIIYKQVFGTDVLPKVLPAVEAMLDLAISTDGTLPDHDALEQAMIDMSAFEMTTVFEIVWSMAKSASQITKDEIVPEFSEWVNTLEAFPLDILVPELLGDVIKSFVSEKNRDRLQKTVQTMTAATL